MIETLLSDREPLKLVLHIIDIAASPSKDDMLMYDWLKHYEIPVCIVTTKADKIPKSKWQKHLKIFEKHLGFDPADPFIMFSSETGLGKDELWAVIRRSHCRNNEEAEESDEVIISNNEDNASKVGTHS